MKSKRLPTILIAIAFLIVVVFSCVFAFSVNEVRADFSVTGGFDSESVQASLDTFKGKNIVFLRVEDVKTEIEKNPKCEVTEIKKEFPNVVSVSVKERVETFKINVGEVMLVLSDEGYVLDKAESFAVSGDRLFSVSLGTITVTDDTLGKKIITDNDEVFYTLLELAKFVDLTDTATEIAFNEIPYTYREAVISMRSGVKIKMMVSTDENFGLDMIEKAFDAYNGKLLNGEGKAISDYEKFTSSILVVRLKEGGVKVTWSDTDA